MGAAILMASMFDFPARLIEGSSTNPHNFISMDSDVAGSTDSAQGRLSALMSYLKKEFGCTSDDGVRQQLLTDLDDGCPWFTFLEQKDELIETMAEIRTSDNSSDKILEGILYVFEQHSENPTFIKDIFRLQNHARDLFMLLDDLEAKRDKGK